MNKKIIASSVAFATAIGVNIAMLAPSAPAITCVGGVCQGGDIRHYSPDNGYDAAIIVFCNYGDSWAERKLVAEGSSSTTDCGKDTDEIYVRSGEEIWCAYSTGPTYEDEWLLTFDATGRHKINDFWSKRCVVQVD